MIGVVGGVDVGSVDVGSVDVGSVDVGDGVDGVDGVDDDDGRVDCYISRGCIVFKLIF